MRKIATLAARKNNLRNLEETFTYDHLNRLTDVRLNNAPTGHMAYDALGRMTDKQSDGQQVFASAQHDYVGPDGQLRPHAISSAQTGDGFPQAGIQSIDYTMFDKVRSIRYDAGAVASFFSYGYDHQRIMHATVSAIETKMKFYVGNCEFVSEYAKADRSFTYLTGPLGVFAVVEQRGEDKKVYYVYKDHLGSWTTITNANGNVMREQSFDAWGNLRNPNTWTGTVTQPPMFDRGFTGHEHLNSFGLINMNGRMYDPIMSSFLSVDNYVQRPDFSQSFNRYAYCLNNPLRYTDPDGEWFLTGGVGFGKLKDGYGLTSLSVGVNFGFWGVGLNLGFDNDGISSVGVYGELGPHIGSVGANLTLGVGYDFQNSTLTGSLSANYGISAGDVCNLGVGVTGVCGYGLNTGQYSYGFGANIGASVHGDIWGIGIGGSYSRYYGQNSFGWGLSGYYDIPRVYDFNIHDNHQSKPDYCVPGALEEVSNSLGINASVDFWVEKYRMMQEGRGKGTVSVVHDGEYYKLVMTYPDYQFEGVPDKDILNLVNTTGWSCSEMIWPQADVNVFVDAYRDNGRVLVGMLVKDGASGHMAMVSKVKIYSSGSYKVYFSETSPIPHVPTVSSNLARDLGGARYYSFKLRY